MRKIEMFALKEIPSIAAGDDLAPIIELAAGASGLTFRDGDIVVVAQKIVSKAEGRLVRLADIVPSPHAVELAAQTGKDARLAELVLRESNEILRSRPNVLIAEHRLGHIMANVGIADRSLTVMRFWNSDAAQNLTGVLEAIAARIQDLRATQMTATRRWRADLPLSGGGGQSALRR
jgi:F420-0:gamma-glutamyl ligase